MKRLLAIPAVLLAQSVVAAPFDECPAQAFLTQSSVAESFAINLVTGGYKMLAEDMGTKGSVNGLGFNPVDRFIYGWSYEHQTLARVHSDFKIEPLKFDNISKSTGFYVGDVHPSNNKYYVYRKGEGFGLYSINVDEESADYLKMEKIVDGGVMSLRIADMAINPMDEYGYAVDAYGELFKMDVTTGDFNSMGNVGASGGFGAAYFDPDGNMYIGRNSDGSIFKIAIGAGEIKSVLFARGPSSSINDGSRCALAPVIDASDTNIDFGDAPDSYGTYLKSNGARHGLSSDNKLYLGSSVDGEADSSAYPLADDTNAEVDDEDGVQIATSLVEGRRAVVVVESSGPGFLNGWVDVDRNGVFDGQDQVISDVQVKEGKQAIYIDVPDLVREGETWARFRVSSTAGLAPTGGASDGEVEDHMVKLVESDTTVNYYPSKTGWTTLAFEDNWPHEGDYDMNDLVTYLRTAVHSRPAGVTQVDLAGEIAAVGAAYHNGFAIRLPGVYRDQVDEENIQFEINGREVEHRLLESGRKEAILMITYNMWDFVDSGELCLFYRTEPGCGSRIQMDFKASVPMKEPVAANLKGAFDPFLFATPGAWHGGHFASAPGRGYEIHMKNQEPTEAFDRALFNQEGDDASDERSTFFLTKGGLPFALEVGTRWDYPVEYRDIGHAYELFQKYAASNGLHSPYWYNPDYTNAELIFKD